MTVSIDRKLYLYGGFLIFAGLMGFLSNPEKAKTALLSGGTFGGLSILFGVLVAKGFVWARAAALITTGFLAIVFTWRATDGWLSVFEGNSAKIFTAVLISSMLAASLVMFTGLRRLRK